MGLVKSHGNRSLRPFRALDYRSGQVFHNVRRNRSNQQKERKDLPKQSSYFILFSGIHGQNRQGKHRMETNSLWRRCTFGKVKPRRMCHQC